MKLSNSLILSQYRARQSKSIIFPIEKQAFFYLRSIRMDESYTTSRYYYPSEKRTLNISQATNVDRPLRKQSR